MMKQSYPDVFIDVYLTKICAERNTLSLGMIDELCRFVRFLAD